MTGALAEALQARLRRGVHWLRRSWPGARMLLAAGPVVLGSMVHAAGESGTGVARPGTMAAGQLGPVPVGERKLDLTRAVRAALANDPEVLEAQARMLQQGSRIDLARAGYYPQVGFSTRTEYNSVLERSVQVASVSASQLLYDFGRTGGEVAYARAGHEAEAAKLAQVTEEIAEQVARDFLGWWRNLRLLEEAQQQVAAIRRIADLTADRGEMGAAARSDVQQALARVEAARGVQWQLQADARASRRSLQQRLAVAAASEPSEQLPEAFADACAGAAPTDPRALPRIMRADALAEQAESEIRQARASRLPRVSLDLRTDHFFDSDIPNQTEHAVLLNVSADLYRGGASRSRLAVAEHGLNAARAQRSAALRTARQRWRDAAEGMQETTVRLQTLERRIGNLAEVRELYEAQYVTAGSRTLLDLLNAEQEYFQARFDLLELEHEQRQLQLECLATQGLLRDSFGLEAAPQMTTEYPASAEVWQ